MNKLEYKNLSELFELGINLNDNEKIAFIVKVREFSSDKANELERMLAVDPSELGLNAATSEFHKMPHQTKGQEIPDTIGKFSILSILGAGGMGIVYLGQRQDINQLVAVKVSNSLLPEGARSLAITHEAKILASLKHPSIASLVDWGTFGEQGHYVAMEYVDGLSIFDYCEKHSLSIVNRIKLFIQVIKAIDYAHSNLVIHRDLKPANILVDDSGAPILIDFGIARLMKSETGIHHQTQGAAHTPSFASPEQIRGEALSIRSDIYSLGAVLFNLFTGQQIKTNDTVATADIEKIFEQESKNPTQSKIWRSINKQKLKDLSVVTNKSIATDQNQRYHNAHGFAEDLQAILDVKPIKARAPSNWYKFKKFIARNRMASSIITLAILATIIATVFGAWQWNEAIKHRDEAIIKQQEKVKYAAFLTEIMNGMNTNSGNSANVTLDEFLARAVETYKAEKEVTNYQMAWFAHTLAGIFEGRGNTKKALNIYALGLEHAYSSREPLDDVGLLVAVALLHGSDLQFDLGINAAEKSLLLINQFPETAWKKALALLSLAYSQLESGQLIQSIATSNKIINDPKSHIAYIGNAHQNIADSLSRMFDYDSAIIHLNKALKIFRARYGDISSQVTESESLLYSIMVKMDISNFNLTKQNQIIQNHNKIFRKLDPEQAVLMSRLAEIHFLKNNLDKSIIFQQQAIDVLISNVNFTPISLHLLQLKMVELQLNQGNDIQAYKNIEKINDEHLNQFPNHSIAQYYLIKTRMALAKENAEQAIKMLNQAKKYLKDSEYLNLLAEHSFRTAQLAALEKDYKSCYNNAQQATEQADSFYPKTWQLSNAYRYLQDVCKQKLNGINDNNFPYLEDVLNSPWKQETVVTTKILNSE